AKVYQAYPEDETKLFYALSIMGTIKEGDKGFERQGQAAKLLEEVFKNQPEHPGVLHYLVHVYDDPVHAEQGLLAARRYSTAAAAVPHALHMPSHIYTRLGYWNDSASTNEKAWTASENDVIKAGEKSTLRDFHSLNYLQYAYLQLGQFKKAHWALETISSEYESLADKKTAKDTPELQSRHVRGRTIYSLPDRIVYGYFDMLTRYFFEAKDWNAAQNIPLPVKSNDFLAVKLHLECIAAAHKGDASSSSNKARQLAVIAAQSGQHPFVKKITMMMAKEAQAYSALAAKNSDQAIDKMREAIQIEDSIDSLSQPPYPSIPAHELFGDLLMTLNRPKEAQVHYAETLKRTPNRPMAIFGSANASAAMGDKESASKFYKQFLELWNAADNDRPELLIAKDYVAKN
ncbi:MAG: tetratricopeptide repeat protein, partial [Methylocystis sp.]